MFCRYFCFIMEVAVDAVDNFPSFTSLNLELRWPPTAESR